MSCVGCGSQAPFFCLCTDPVPSLCSSCFRVHLHAAPAVSHFKIPVEARGAVQNAWDIPEYLEQRRQNAELVQPLSDMVQQLQQLLSN